MKALRCHRCAIAAIVASSPPVLAASIAAARRGVLLRLSRRRSSCDFVRPAAVRPRRRRDHDCDDRISRRLASRHRDEPHRQRLLRRRVARDCGVARGTEVKGRRMSINHRISRREFCGAGAGNGLRPSAFPLPAFAQAAARVVVIGGGFGGASCARALKADRSETAGHAGRAEQDLHRLPVQQRRHRRTA